ncbi:hypothetical protein VNO80_01926 [Phaseolus coccineus]|uniref:Uncharacterized protein n=1 Tax=Phaseolus coccineus TaxID=3886 RepID=A0AAN9WXR4_PHACN
MEKFDQHDFYSDPRDEATSKGKTEEIMNSSLMDCSSLSYSKNNPTDILADNKINEISKINKMTEIINIFNMFDKYEESLFEIKVVTKDDELKQLLLGDPILSQKYKDLLKIKKESHSPYTVIEIAGENGTIHKKHPKQHDLTIWATFYAGQIAIACCLGNPLDMLSKLEDTSKVKEQSQLSFGEALPVFLPSMTVSAMFALNFIYTTILTPPLPFRVPANSISLLLLFYYILVLAKAMSGSGVLWGSVQIPALLFVSGGAIGLMMLIGFIIIMVKFIFKRKLLSKLG